MATPIWKRVIAASGWSILTGRIVLPSELIGEWLSALENERIRAIGISTSTGVATLRVKLAAVKDGATELLAKVALEEARLDSERFFLRLQVVQKPYVGGDQKGLLEAVSALALELLTTESLVRLIDAAAGPIVKGKGDVLEIDFDHIDVVKDIFEKPLFFGRLRDVVTLREATIHPEGLVLQAYVFFGRMLRNVFGLKLKTNP